MVREIRVNEIRVRDFRVRLTRVRARARLRVLRDESAFADI